ncbi:MAG: hypothetical protein ACRYGC_16200 [Janthinobacterium lividum]
MTHAAAIRPGAAVLLAVLCLPPAARAEAPPLLIPTRDVDVVYRMPPPPGAAATPATTPAPTQRLRWRVADRRLRVDPPGEGVFMIVDYAAHSMEMVEIGARQVIDMPPPPGLGAAAPSGARFERLGQASVADTACTEWRTTDMQGAAATVCLTPDGVLLRAASGSRVMAEATRVSYAPQDTILFRVPDGYRHVAPAAAPAAAPR